MIFCLCCWAGTASPLLAGMQFCQFYSAYNTKPPAVASSVLEICRASPLAGQGTGGTGLWMCLHAQSKLQKEENTVKALKMVLAVLIDIPETN